MSLARQLLGSPTVGDTLKSMTLGHSDNVDVLILLKDGGNLDRLLEELVAEVDLVSNRTTVELNLHEMSLLLGEAGLADLGVRKDTDNSAVLANALELTSDGLAAILGVLLGVASEGLLLGAVPVLVEATLELIGEMVGPDGGEGAEAAGGFDISNETDDNERGRFDNGDGLDNLTLMELCKYVRLWVRMDKDGCALDPGRSRSRTTWVMPAL